MYPAAEGGIKVREVEKKDIEIKEVIATGKTGKIHRGWWISQDKPIAVKIVTSEAVMIREVSSYMWLMYIRTSAVFLSYTNGL